MSKVWKSKSGRNLTEDDIENIVAEIETDEWAEETVKELKRRKALAKIQELADETGMEL